MIESFDKNSKEVKYSIIPRLKRYSEITLSRGDTLIIYWDFAKYPMDEAEHFFQILQKAFPDNQVIFMPLETKMEVVKND